MKEAKTEEQIETVRDGNKLAKEYNTPKENFVLNATMLVDVDESDYDYLMGLTTAVGAKQLDITVANDSFTDYYSNMDAYLDLEEFLTPQEIAVYKDRFYYSKDGNGKEYPCGIDISGTKMVRDCSMTLEHPILCFFRISNNLEEAKEYLDYIFTTH